MIFKVIITQPANDDLISIKNFIAQDDALAAIRVADHLVNAAEMLQNHPLRNPEFLRKPQRKMVVSGTPYLIFYRVDEDARIVYVVHFWHGARRSPKF